MLNLIDNPTVRRFSGFANAVLVFMALLCVFIAVNRTQMPHGLPGFLSMRITVKNLLITIICLSGGAIVFHGFGLTQLAIGVPFWRELIKVIKACTITAGLALLFPITSHSGAFTLMTICYFWPAAIVACLCGRFVARMLTVHVASTLSGSQDLIIVGSGPRAASLYRRIQASNNPNLRILGFVDSPSDHTVPAEVQQRLIGGLENLEAILMRQPVDEVLIALPAKSCYAQIQAAIRICERAGVEAKYLSDIFQVSLARPRFEPDQETSVVSLKVVHDDSRILVKRFMDIIGAATGLLVLGPLMLAIATAIRLTSLGPAVFVQERFGLRKRRFKMYKFRTMVLDAEKLQETLEAHNEVQGPTFKIRKDPRITPLGRLLRKTSLDELPQFFNVLNGEMSLVGPRPLPLRDVSKFDDASLMRRFSVKPGLTCLWQINGRSDTSFDHWIKLDLQYIDSWSLTLDLEILLKTLPSVVIGRGAV